MILFVTLLALGMLGLPALMRPAGRRINPRQWAKLAVAAILAGAALFEVAALLAAAPPILRVIGLRQLASACERMLGRLSPGGAPIAVVAGVLAVAVPTFFWRGIARSRRVAARVRIGDGLGRHLPLSCGSELVIVPETRPLAMSVPGTPGQVVVSQGVVEQLEPAEFRAVCDHESAHLRLRHGRYLEFAVAVERAFRLWPPAVRSTRTLRLALERWADEEAVGDCEERRVALREALLQVAFMDVAGELAAFSGAAGLFERIAALDALPGRPHLAWWLALVVPGVVLGVAATYSLGAWGVNAYCAVGMANHCMT